MRRFTNYGVMPTVLEDDSVLNNKDTEKNLDVYVNEVHVHNIGPYHSL